MMSEAMYEYITLLLLNENEFNIGFHEAHPYNLLHMFFSC